MVEAYDDNELAEDPTDEKKIADAEKEAALSHQEKESQGEGQQSGWWL